MRTVYPFPCLLLSGMPGTGKDTLSQGLSERDQTFVFFKKHRAGPATRSRTEDDSYVNVSTEVFQDIARCDGFIQYHGRYERMYGVLTETYANLVHAGKIPIIHVGKYENLRALRKGGIQDGLSILLWADRTIVQARLQERHKSRIDSVEERLLAYDEEVALLKKHVIQGTGLLDFDLLLINNGSDPDVAANQLHSLLQAQELPPKKDVHEHILQLLHF